MVVLRRTLVLCGLLILLLSLTATLRAQNIWTKITDPPSPPAPPFTGSVRYQYVNDSTLYALNYNDVKKSSMTDVETDLILFKSLDAGTTWSDVGHFEFNLQVGWVSLFNLFSFHAPNNSTLFVYGRATSYDGRGDNHAIWASLKGKQHIAGYEISPNAFSRFDYYSTTSDGFDFVAWGQSPDSICSTRVYRVDPTGNWDTIFKGIDSVGHHCNYATPIFRNRNTGIVIVNTAPYFPTLKFHEALRTTNGGATWSKIKFAGEDVTHHVYAVQICQGRGRVWVASCTFQNDSAGGPASLLERSSDDGTSWQIDGAAPLEVHTLKASADSEIYCSVYGSTILYQDQGPGNPWRNVLLNLLSREFSYIGDSLIFDSGYQTVIRKAPSAVSPSQQISKAIASLDIFPNPAIDRVTIAYHPKSRTLQRIQELLVLDITGRVIAKRIMEVGVEGQCTVPLGKLSAGLYFVRIPGEALSAKFVIQH